MTHNNIIIKEDLIWDKGGLFEQLMQVQDEFVNMIKSDAKRDAEFDAKIKKLATRKKELREKIKHVQSLEATI